MTERKHKIALFVRTNNGECVSTIPNPRAYADEGGPEWIMRYGNPEPHRHVIASVIGTFDYLLSPEYTLASVTERLRDLRKAYRQALLEVEGNKTPSPSEAPSE
jgi:hypothetical protein